MSKLLELVGPEKYEEMKQWWNGDIEPNDQEILIGQAFTIAQDSFGYDISVCCGKEQEYIGNAFYEAIQTAHGEVTDAVLLAVGRALVAVLASPHCEDYFNCDGSNYEPEV